MEQAIYTWMAVIGCGILLVQVILQVVGVADHDVGAGDADGFEGDWFFGFLSFKTLVAFVGFFGLTGLLLLDRDMGTPQRALYATLAGLLAVVVVGYLMKLLHGLGHSGTLELANALGVEGTVYLRIPAAGTGRGKVTLDVQGRSVEVGAVTDGPELATGTRVRVVEIPAEDLVRVEAR
ncbi:MAG: hypothetical protein AB7T63_08900 [Planctomycetota bacterium]